MLLLQCVNTGEKIELRQEISQSGEGKIYQTSKDGFLAKIYHSCGREKINKLRIMVDNPPEDPTLARGHISIAWPKDLLKDTDGKCLGFLMPAIQGSQTLINVYNPHLREKKAPGFNWHDLHLTALHLALLIRSLHASNYVVGDLKPENLLVNERALVSIIDTDSFQVIDPRTGKIYLSPVASSEYTPPEMFGEVLQTVGRSEVHDRFGLAIIIWLLLFGYHPFSGKWVGDGNQPNIDELIRCGYWMYGSNSKIRPGKYSMPLKILHPDLQQCFRQCFNDGHNNPYTRPSAADWVKSLDIALKDLKHCSIEAGHYYARSYGKCYWCKRKRKLGGIDIFKSPASDTHIRANQPIMLAIMLSSIMLLLVVGSYLVRHCDEPTPDRPPPKPNNCIFPMDKCGDRDPGGDNDWYGVTVRNKNNLEYIQENFCRDAFVRPNRRSVIQVASFLSRSKAEDFVKKLKEKGFKGAAVFP